MGRQRKAGELVSIEELQRGVEQWIETGRGRPRKAKLPKEFGELAKHSARAGAAAAASAEESERTQHEQHQKFLRSIGAGEVADGCEAVWAELQTYRRAIDRRNTHVAATNTQKVRGMVARAKGESKKGKRDADQTAQRKKEIKGAMAGWLKEGLSKEAVLERAKVKYGYDQGTQQRRGTPEGMKRKDRRYSVSQLLRMRAEVAREMKKAPGR